MKRRDFLMTTLAAGALSRTGSAGAGEAVPFGQGPESASLPTEQA